MNSKGFVRPRTVGQIGIAAVIAVLACFLGSAAASTGGAATPGTAPSAKGSPSGTPAATPSAGAITLLAGKTSPRKSFYFGYRYPRLSFTIGSSQPENDLEIDVVNAAGEVVKTFYRENVAPDVETKVRWDGTTNEGRPARNGRYSFRISPQSASATVPAARKATSLDRPQPRLRLLRLRLPGPRSPRIRDGRRAASAPPAPATRTRART